MGTQRDGGLVARAVREALGTLVSPQMYGQIVARALQGAGLHDIPESGRVIATWVEDHLQREIEQAVGSDAAELVGMQLAPIVAHASSQPEEAPKPAAFGSEKPTSVAVAQLTARDKREQMKSTARIRLSSEQLRQLTNPGETTRPGAVSGPLGKERGKSAARVLAVTADDRAVASLQHTLAGSAVVVQATDLVGLLDALDEARSQEPVVLLDCIRPAIHVNSLAAMSEDLPKGSTIVLWGASEETWRELDRERSQTCRWVRCSHEATLDDLGSLCAMLIG